MSLQIQPLKSPKSSSHSESQYRKLSSRHAPDPPHTITEDIHQIPRRVARLPAQSHQKDFSPAEIFVAAADVLPPPEESDGLDRPIAHVETCCPTPSTRVGSEPDCAQTEVRTAKFQLALNPTVRAGQKHIWQLGTCTGCQIPSKPPCHKNVLDKNCLLHAPLRTSKIEKHRSIDKVYVCRGEAESLRDSQDTVVAQHQDGSHNMFMCCHQD